MVLAKGFFSFWRIRHALCLAAIGNNNFSEEAADAHESGIEGDS